MSERLAFVLMFSLMAAFVVGLTVLAAKSGGDPLIGRTVPASPTLAPRVHDELGGGERRADADNACRPAAGPDRRNHQDLCAAVGRP
jgi:hypothetical protein